MKKFLLQACVLIFLCAGCGKEKTGCQGVEPDAEVPQIESYAASAGISVAKLSNGLYYNIADTGYGARPSIKSTVAVTYTGKLLNGIVFDSTANTKSFYLNEVIEGWQLGIPLVKKGGRIKLLIPSALAYGCNGKEGIPANSVLFFDVHLVDVE